MKPSEWNCMDESQFIPNVGKCMHSHLPEIYVHSGENIICTWMQLLRLNEHLVYHQHYAHQIL